MLFHRENHSRKRCGYFEKEKMTYGSKGVFGFIGNTMNNSASLVKDRTKITQIKTNGKITYLVQKIEMS